MTERWGLIDECAAAVIIQCPGVPKIMMKRTLVARFIIDSPFSSFLLGYKEALCMTAMQDPWGISPWKLGNVLDRFSKSTKESSPTSHMTKTGTRNFHVTDPDWHYKGLYTCISEIECSSSTLDHGVIHLHPLSR